MPDDIKERGRLFLELKGARSLRVIVERVDGRREELSFPAFE